MSGGNNKKLNIFGLILVLFGIFAVISCLSYHSDDASFNVVTDEKVRNIFSRPGAYVADALMQSMGISVFLFLGTLIFWGGLLLMEEKIFLFWLRIPAIIGMIISTSGFIELFISYKDFYYEFIPGGYIGYWFYHNYVIKTLLGKITAGFGLFVAMVCTCYLSLGINKNNASNIANNLIKIISIPLIVIRPFQMLMRFFRSVKRYSATSYKDLTHKRSLPRVVIRFLKQVMSLVFSKRARESLKSRREMGDFANMMVVNAPNNLVSDESVIPNFLPEKTSRPEISSVMDGGSLVKYVGPLIDFLQEPKVNKAELIDKVGISKMLTQTLLDFGVVGEVVGVNTGPVVSLFEFKPKAGTKSSRVIGLAEDVARTLQKPAARISVIQGKDALGIELPNKVRTTIYLKELINSPAFHSSGAALPMALGKDIAGNPVITDLAKMPHLLIAGTTGSGKSVGINTMILSLIYKLSPADCRMIMIDPKMLELSVYDGIPHLMTPVITDSKKAIVALKWAVAEMENRYKIMSSLGVRNVVNYNMKVEMAIKSGTKLTRQIDLGYNRDLGRMETETIVFEPKKMPYIVLIVDEMADLMIVAGKEVEAQIQRLAQMARAAGIHIIMATQRPSVDVITGVIKANFPSRISFQVTSKIDSRTILGEQGAEQLLGQGDMLFMQGASKIQRIHGPFVADSEVEEIVRHLKDNNPSDYVDIIEYHEENSPGGSYDLDQSSGGAFATGKESDEELYKMAVRVIMEDKRTSISYVQRKLRIGYNKAATLIERMEEDGILSSPDKTGKRIIMQEK